MQASWPLAVVSAVVQVLLLRHRQSEETQQSVFMPTRSLTSVWCVWAPKIRLAQGRSLGLNQLSLSTGYTGSPQSLTLPPEAESQIEVYLIK